LTIAQQVLQADSNSEEPLQSSCLFMKFFTEIQCNDKNHTFLATLICRKRVEQYIQKGLLKAITKMKAMLNSEGKQSEEEKLQFAAFEETCKIIQGTKSLESVTQLMIAMNETKFWEWK